MPRTDVSQTMTLPETCCDEKLSYQMSFSNCITEASCNKCGKVYGKRMGSEIAYKQNGPDTDFICQKCGGDILIKEVIHSIHDGPFPLSGSGKTQKECLPYCPHCEKEDSIRGTIITAKPSPSKSINLN